MSIPIADHLAALTATDATDVEFRVAAGLVAAALDADSMDVLESHAAIGARCGKSKAMVEKAVRGLGRRGWLQRGMFGGSWWVTRLLVPAPESQAPPGVSFRPPPTEVPTPPYLGSDPPLLRFRPVGGEGGGASLSLDPLPVPDDLLVPPKSESSRKRPSRSEAKSPGTAPLFAEEVEPTPVKRRARVRGECTSEQWDRVHGAFVKGRKISGIAGWGPRDVSSNRNLVAKVLAEFEPVDFDRVIAHSAESIARGDDPKWHTLAHTCGKFADRVERADAGTVRRSRHSTAITLTHSDREETQEEIDNDPQMIRARMGQE